MCTRSLQTLNLGHNRVTNEGIHTLKEGLLRNHSLQRLGLLNTRLSSEGTEKVTTYLALSMDRNCFCDFQLFSRLLVCEKKTQLTSEIES